MGTRDKATKYLSLASVVIILIFCYQSSTTLFPKVLLAPSVGLASRYLRFLTWDGAVAGVLVGSIIILTGWAQAGALLSFFVTASVATKVSRRLKPVSSVNHALDDDSKKGRGAHQVFAVSAVPALLCLFSAAFFRPYLPVWLGSLCAGHEELFMKMYFAYLACCSADTLSSELGGLSPRPPLLLLTLQAVPTGVDGAVSLEGLIASAVGGGLVGAFSPWSWLWFALWGTLGSLFDSLLGCLLQPSSLRTQNPRKWQVMNVLVNFLSASATGLVAAAVPWASPLPQLVACGLLLLCLRVSPLGNPAVKNS